jgi:hypothetical protein
MSRSKYEFILKMIDDIEYAVSRHTSVTEALSDRVSKPAILMSLMQIGETLGKMSFDNPTLAEYAKAHTMSATS